MNYDIDEHEYMELKALEHQERMIEEQHYWDEVERAEELGLLSKDEFGNPDLTEYYDYLDRLKESASREEEL